MHSGSAGDDENVVEASQRFGSDTAFLEVRETVLDSRCDCGLYGCRLLVDFLNHKVREAALLGAVLVKVSGFELLFNHSAVEITEARGAVFEDGNLAVLEQIIILCVFDNRGNVGRDERLAETLTDNQRRLTSDRVDCVGTVGKDDSERERTSDFVEHLSDTANGVAVVVEVEELSHDLGVGVAEELGAVVLDKELFDFFIVFDNSVVDDCDASARMRVRVDVGRLAVSCPSRVTYARVTLGLAFLFHFRYKVREPAL